MGHETVKHFLLDCLATTRICAHMMAEIRREMRSTSMLLSQEDTETTDELHQENKEIWRQLWNKGIFNSRVVGDAE